MLILQKNKQGRKTPWQGVAIHGRVQSFAFALEGKAKASNIFTYAATRLTRTITSRLSIMIDTGG